MADLDFIPGEIHLYIGDDEIRNIEESLIGEYNIKIIYLKLSLFQNP